MDKKSLTLTKNRKIKLMSVSNILEKFLQIEKKNNSDYYVKGVFFNPADFKNLFHLELSCNNDSNDQNWDDTCRENNDTDEKLN